MGYLFMLLAVSMAVSAVGWIYFIYFFSVGYGFSIAALAVAVAALFLEVIYQFTLVMSSTVLSCRA